MPSQTPSQTFPADRRVRKSGDFQAAQRTGARVAVAHFQLVVAPAPAVRAGGASRLGLVVSRKVGCAVERNRVKRWCRECFRRSAWVPPGVDLIVVARPGAADLGLAALEAEWSGVRQVLARKASQVLAKATPRTHAARPLAP